MSITVRPAEPADAEALAPLHVQVWDEAYTGLMPQQVIDDRKVEPMADKVERWRRRITTPQATTWVAEAGDELVGFVSSGRGRDGSGALELMALYVRASHYGTGLGHRLLVTAVGDRPAYLWVLEGNDRALRFYERQGFVLDGQVEEEVEGRHLRMVRV